MGETVVLNNQSINQSIIINKDNSHVMHLTCDQMILACIGRPSCMGTAV